MADNSSTLEKLINIAESSGSNERRALLSEITNVFLENAEAHTDRDRQYFGAIMGQVAFELEQSIREELAQRLAQENLAPHDLIVRLAKDNISVAQPILENSQVLNDDDLVEITQSSSQDHMMAMTRREDISETVSAALIDNGNSYVVEGVVKNSGAKISDTSMQRVVEISRDNENLHRPVLARPDLPFDLMQDMFDYVSMDLKQDILEHTKEIAPEKLNDMLQDVRAKFDRKGKLRSRVLSKPEVVVQSLEDKGQLTEQAMVSFIRKNKYAEFLVAFGKLADIDIKTAKRLAEDKTGEGLAIACKASGFDRSTFSSILMALSHGSDRAINETYRLINQYDRLQLEVAQRTIRFWRVTKKASGEAPSQPTTTEETASPRVRTKA